MRQILRQREIVADDWVYAAETPEGADGGQSVIVPLAEFRANEAKWSTWSGRLGLKLAPADKVEDIASLLPRLNVVAIDFPGPSEGRGYTSARLLRERFHYTGELRATGAVKRDQIFLLSRCGFDSFEVAPGESLEAAQAALHRFSVAYQPSSDVADAAPHMRSRA